jgi:hypothetical protein
VDQILGLGSDTCEFLNSESTSPHPALLRLSTTPQHTAKESDCHDHGEA